MLCNDAKFMLNELQNHITKDTDKILLVFDNKFKLDKWKREHQNDIEYYDYIPVMLGEIVYEQKLVGIRFKRYNFVVD